MDKEVINRKTDMVRKKSFSFKCLAMTDMHNVCILCKIVVGVELTFLDPTAQTDPK